MIPAPRPNRLSGGTRCPSEGGEGCSHGIARRLGCRMADSYCTCVLHFMHVGNWLMSNRTIRYNTTLPVSRYSALTTEEQRNVKRVQSMVASQSIQVRCIYIQFSTVKKETSVRCRMLPILTGIKSNPFASYVPLHQRNSADSRYSWYEHIHKRHIILRSVVWAILQMADVVSNPLDLETST
jgi:hypothetical protein